IVATADARIGRRVIIAQDDKRAFADAGPERVVRELILAAAIVGHVAGKILEDHPAHVEAVLHDQQFDHIGGCAGVKIFVDHHALRPSRRTHKQGENDGCKAKTNSSHYAPQNWQQLLTTGRTVRLSEHDSAHSDPDTPEHKGPAPGLSTRSARSN